MNPYQPGFTAPPPGGINPAFHQILLQVIESLTQQLDPQVKQILMGQLTQNQGLITNLHTYVYQVAAQRGVNLAMGQSLHQNDLGQILYTWTSDAVKMIRQQLQQSMGLPNQPMMGFTGMGMSPISTGSIYSTGGDRVQPVTPPPAAPQTPAYQPQAQDIEIMPVEALNWSRRDNDENDKLDKTRGISLIDIPLEAYHNQVRVSLYSFKSKRIANDAFEAYRELYHLIPAGMKRGYWTQRVLYTELATLNLDTQVFLELRDKIREKYNTEKWRWVVNVLQSASQGVWAKLDTYLTEQLNQRLLSRLRVAEHINTSVSIQTVADLDELLDPHFSSPLVEHPEFTKTLDELINSVMMETFIHNTAVTSEPAPLMKSRAVDYFDGNTTKYDYGMLDADKRDALLKDLLRKTTVLQLPRCFVASNGLPGDTVTRLRNPQYILPPDRQGVFGQSIDHLLSDNKPIPDVVVVNQFRVSPKEFLNLLRPIYPMGKKELYLVGNAHQIGW